MSWVVAAVATIAVGTAAYSADQQRKAVHSQQDALKASQEADARQAAEAETAAQVAANAKLADSKQRRRASALGLGDTSGGDPLGGAGTVLASGGPSPAARAAAGAGAAGSYGGTALGAGAPSSYGSAGRVYTPRTPSRASSV